MEHLDTIQAQIHDATAHWQAIQEQASKTMERSQELTQQMGAQLQAFQSAGQRVHDQEAAHLRLESEKWKRTEVDWVQTGVRMLDHVYALQQAAIRSGQPELIRELTQFQAACRDAARRVGLTPFTPARDEPFDSRAHQTQSLTEAAIAPGARIGTVVAPGFTYQGQLLRRALVVLLESGETPAVASSAPAQAESAMETAPNQPAEPAAGPAFSGKSEPGLAAEARQRELELDADADADAVDGAPS
jgi:molecular chaperone GrpE (heat shock protein)